MTGAGRDRVVERKTVSSEGTCCGLSARTHSRDSDASHAPAEDGLLGYTTAQLQKGRNKETPPCSSTTAKHRQHTDNKLKREQACRTLGLKEERYVMRVPGASFATSIPGQQLGEPQSECQQLQVKPAGATRKAIVSWQND